MNYIAQNKELEHAETYLKNLSNQLKEDYEERGKYFFVGRLSYLMTAEVIVSFLLLGVMIAKSVPIILEFTSGNEHDYLGLTSSLTGILCVILVAEGRASNYLFGLISNIIYFYLALSNLFYGEVMIAVFYVVMQPIGIYAWLTARIKNTETSEFVARKESIMDYIKYFVFVFVAWLGMGFAFQSIGSARPFRDAITNGLSVGAQIGQTQRFANLSWLLWVLTNVFSIYLWWGTNIHIQGMYWVYLLNSIVGWYNWVKSTK